MIALLAAALVAGCGASSATAGSPDSPVKVSAKNLGQVGTVLVDAKGQALYMFANDRREHLTCT